MDLRLPAGLMAMNWEVIQSKERKCSGLRSTNDGNYQRDQSSSPPISAVAALGTDRVSTVQLPRSVGFVLRLYLPRRFTELT